MATEDPLRRLDRVLALGLPRAVRMNAARPAPPAGSRVHPVAEMRLIVPLEGVKHEAFGDGKTVVSWAMRAGDVLVLRPDTWLTPRFHTRHRHLGVIRGRDRVRLSWNRCEGRDELPQPLVTEDAIDAPMPEHSPLARAADALIALDFEHDAAAAPHLVLAFLHLLRSAAARPQQPADGAERTWLQAMHYLQDNCHLPIGREEAARALGLSPNYLSRLCRARARRTLVEVLTDFRLQKACAMLRAVDLPLAEIARTCGFAEAGYFIRRFRRAFGTTPAAYRRAQMRSG